MGVFLRLSAVALAICISAGCAAVETASASSEPSREVRWNFDASGSHPILYFGVRDTDAVVLGLGCLHGRVEITTYEDERGARRELRSGVQSVELPPATEWAHGTEAWASTSDLPLDEPVLAAFERTGVLTTTRPTRFDFSVSPDVLRREIRPFFRSCRSTH